MASAPAGGRVSPKVAFFVNSTVAFACAQLLTAALHETGHGIAAQLLGFSPHIYAFFEDNPTGDARQTLTILAAGPLTSLVLGAAFWAWFSRLKARNTFGRLLLLWLALGGVMLFVNYLIVTPWLTAGDTAQFADVLHWSPTARYGVTAVGLALLFEFARPAARAIYSFAPPALALDSTRARWRFIMPTFYLPLFAGVALTGLAGIGGQLLIVGYGLLATLSNIDIVVATMYARDAVPLDGERAPQSAMRIEPLGIGLYAALVLLYVFAFSRGVPV